MVRLRLTRSLSLHRTPIFGRISLIVAATGFYSLAVVFADQILFPDLQTVGAGFHGFLGLVLGWLLVFRTNTSYDRWWEGRKAWGQLINDSRNLAIKVQACVHANSAEKQRLGKWLINFSLALRDHLRGGAKLSSFPEFDGTDPSHVPAYISERIYEQLEQWRQQNQLGGFEMLFLDQHAAALLNICGTCERIQKSPISRSYRSFVRQSIAIYVLTLPWGLMESFHWWTVPAVVMLSYFMIGLETIAEEIEDPFGTSEDDLMLDDLCASIRKSVTELLLEPSCTPPPTTEP